MMRSRAPRRGARGNPAAVGYGGDFSVKYRGAKRRKNSRSVTRGTVLVVIVTVIVASYFYLGTARPRQKPTDDASLSKFPTAAFKPADIAPPRKIWSWNQCTVQPKKKIVVKEKVEPLWLPTYPTSLPIRGYADFLETLTGVPMAATSYYNSSSVVKRCHARHVGSKDKVQAITCDIAHPIVPAYPSAEAANFRGGVLLALRNPLTAFPAWHQYKEEEFHGQVGQVGREAWVEFRDEFVGTTEAANMMPEWKNFIMEWRSMAPYHIAEYLPWEHWNDDHAGPVLAFSLALALKKEGLPVLYDDTDAVGCLWHTHIRAAIAAEERRHAEEGWYEPEYTPQQLRMIAGELDDFAAEIKGEMDGDGARPGDQDLYEILQGYAKSAREALRRSHTKKNRP